MNSSRLGLNALNFFTSAVQVGFGPFIAVWLTKEGWSQSSLGLALSIGTLAALLGQLPGGMLVDQIPSKRASTMGALMALAASALMLFASSLAPMVWGAEVTQSLASAVLTPAIAAVTLCVCGHAAYSAQLGSNTRYASLGAAAAAAVFGVAATASSERAVFLIAACLVAPALAALFMIKADQCVDPASDHPALRPQRENAAQPWHIFKEPGLHVFGIALGLFQLANAALLPFALNDLARHQDAPGYLVSATIIVPQMITAMIAPFIGRLGERWGRRPILLVGFAMVPVRALVFALAPGALALTLVQSLDGMSAAVIGITLPLIAADLTQRSGYLNFAIGALGLASGIGATFSTAIAGWIGSRFGSPATFLFLAGAGALGLLVLSVAMPETRPARPAGPEAAKKPPSAIREA